jgi:3',5'-cyclic AMP phosphodiesterase CpdA
LRLAAAGTDASGQPLRIDPIDVPLAVTAEAGDAPDVVFAGAGDIAACGSAGSEMTARLLDRTPGSVFTLGDNVYPYGSMDNFLNCYQPTWGRHRARTFASPGNHDWEVSAGAPYFGYFGTAAGAAGTGYYSATLGNWHVLALNSNISAQPGSPQYEWVKNDLAAAGSLCTIAYWHHPLFSSSQHGNNAVMREMWRLLQSQGVELVLSGHDHVYERFAPQDADGHFDPRGMREFVVGTGGAGLYGFTSIQPNSDVRANQTYGILKLTLRARTYDWEFLPVDGQSFRDSGTDSCR